MDGTTRGVTGDGPGPILVPMHARQLATLLLLLCACTDAPAPAERPDESPAGAGSQAPVPPATDDAEADPAPSGSTPSTAEADDSSSELPPASSDAAVDGAALPPALADAFEIVDDAPQSHGDREVPLALQHRATGLVFVYVPGGSFTLGSDADDEKRFDDERPPRRVRVTGFYLSVTETTWAAWKRGGGTDGAAPADDHPVNGVTWYQARDWCDANGLSLPTEAQWEYAASGPTDNLYPWGHDPFVKGRANAAGTNDVDLWSQSSPVDSFPDGTAWCGAADMAGNVMEWCLDGWTPDHTDVEPDTLDPLIAPEEEQPRLERLVRGGSYQSDALAHLRCAYRYSIAPNLAGGNLGFRAVVPRFQ